MLKRIYISRLTFSFSFFPAKQFMLGQLSQSLHSPYIYRWNPLLRSRFHQNMERSSQRGKGRCWGGGSGHLSIHQTRLLTFPDEVTLSAKLCDSFFFFSAISHHHPVSPLSLYFALSCPPLFPFPLSLRSSFATIFLRVLFPPCLSPLFRVTFQRYLVFGSGKLVT